MVLEITNVTLPGWNSTEMHFGDGFNVKCHFYSDDLLLTNYSFSVSAKWQDSSYIQHIHYIHDEIRPGLTYPNYDIEMECDATYNCGGAYCGGGFDFPDNERPGTNVPVFLYLTVANFHTGEEVTFYIGMTHTPATVDGYPVITTDYFPAEMLVSQMAYLDCGVVAYGGVVVNPSFGMRLVSGPAPKFWMNGAWRTLTSDFTYWPIITPQILSGTEAIATISFTLPSEGSKTMTLEFIAAKIDQNGNPAVYGTPIQRSTYLKTNIVPTCVEGTQRCAHADGTPDGCQKQICTNNTWVVQNPNDTSCPGCNFNAPCGSTPHDTLACGHPEICSQYKCNNGTWVLNAANTNICGENCAPCPTENATNCVGCKQYKCTGGKWLLADGNAKACGASCGGGTSANTLLYVGVGVVAIGAIGAIYILRKRKQQQP